jgi:predicted AAA+ superfamily ATPase
MIKRDLFEHIKSHLNKKEISLIVGPRQAGKTTLMNMVREYLAKKGGKTVYLNLDIEQDKEYFGTQAKFIRKIELELGKSRGFVFIDEIQRKENAGLFLKGIYDQELPYKFIVSGSGSIELKEKIHESLAGRKRIFELNTLTFAEFVGFKTGYKYEGAWTKFYALEMEKTAAFLDEYLNFGGYPRVVLEPELTEKRKLMNEIYQSYLERDIAYLLRVQKTEAFANLVRVIASQIGKLANISELSSTLGIAARTVNEYLWYLQKTYILQKVAPFCRNTRKEISKAPVFYFNDLGLRNYALGYFGTVQEKGFIFQNFIFNALRALSADDSMRIRFWRTKDQAEVDFIIESARTPVPVEVKYRHMERPEITRSLRNFIERYRPDKAMVINLSLNTTIRLERTRVLFRPYYKLQNNIPIE